MHKVKDRIGPEQNKTDVEFLCRPRNETILQAECRGVSLLISTLDKKNNLLTEGATHVVESLVNNVERAS